MKIRVTISFLFPWLFFACAKEQISSPDTLKAENYFPLDTGNTWVYHVRHIVIDAPVGRFDTLDFELKMTISQHDEETGQFFFERFSRDSAGSGWQPFDVVQVSSDNLTIQWVENNLRFVKLTKPVFLNKSWDGNIYNILPEWKYYYAKLQTTFENEYIAIDDAIVVEERDILNLLQEERAWEVYGRNTGLVYKFEKIMKLNAGNPLTGYTFEFNLKSFDP